MLKFSSFRWSGEICFFVVVCFSSSLFFCSVVSSFSWICVNPKFV